MMNPTIVLTGLIPLMLIGGVVLTSLVSILVLWLYRRAVLRSMRQAAQAQSPPPADDTEVAHEPGDGLRIRYWEAGSEPEALARSSAGYQRMLTSMAASGSVLGVAGVAYALVVTFAWMLAAGGDLAVSRFLVLFLVFSWPTVVSFIIVASGNRAQTLAISLAYFAVLGVVAGWIALLQSGVSLFDSFVLWAVMNAPATILLAAFLRRSVRAIGPIVLAFMIAGITGISLFTLGGLSIDALRLAVAEIGTSIGLNANWIFSLVAVAGFLAFLPLGWIGLIWVGRRYRARGFSDLAPTLDSVWLLFAIAQTYQLAFDGLWRPLFGVVAFGAYKLTSLIGFWVWRKASQKRVAPDSLLLLRVFALGHRSERFFDAFSKWWRRRGPIHMIAGPDLAAIAVEPHEFLDFLSGRISREFIRGSDDLDQRLADLDASPDPDGLYRVHEFFCFTDTWKMTMQQLAKTSQTVLMDLRSFSERNKGCIYEIEQLIRLVDLRRVTFLVDSSTDRDFLEQTLLRLWAAADEESPSRDEPAPSVELFNTVDQSLKSLRSLMALLERHGLPALSD